MKLILRLADASDPGQYRTLESGRPASGTPDLGMAEADQRAWDTRESGTRESGTLSIGRGADNGWVLADPDRTLSKNHCRIDASEGGFMLTDLSTNGVFLAGAAQPVGRGHSVALEDGDSFTIGPYRMQAEIGGGADEPERGGGIGRALGASPLDPAIEEPWLTGLPSGDFGPSRRAAMQGWDAPPDPATYAASGMFEQPGTGGTGLPQDDRYGAEAGAFSQQSEHIAATATVMRLPQAQVVLPTNWMDGDAAAQVAPQAEPAFWPPMLPEEPPPAEPAAALPPEWAMPAAAEAAPILLPAAWDTAPSEPLVPPPVRDADIMQRTPATIVAPTPRPYVPVMAPPPDPAPQAAVAADVAGGTAVTSAGAIAAFLDGAGLPADTLAGLDTEAAFHDIGRMVRAAVEGVRDIMSTRALVKSEFRVDQTVLRRADNNQVKFAPDTQKCLAAMVGAAPPGFLPGATAMQQSMDDIKLHELALVAALNSVFADLGQQLDPDTILRRARQDTGLTTMLPYAREAKCWAIYMETYKLLQESGAANTGGSLLAPLAQAYARQLKRGR